eukprot:1103193-Prymnesium_polylepis.1
MEPAHRHEVALRAGSLVTGRENTQGGSATGCRVREHRACARDGAPADHMAVADGIFQTSGVLRQQCSGFLLEAAVGVGVLKAHAIPTRQGWCSIRRTCACACSHAHARMLAVHGARAVRVTGHLQDSLTRAGVASAAHQWARCPRGTPRCRNGGTQATHRASSGGC